VFLSERRHNPAAGQDGSAFTPECLPDAGRRRVRLRHHCRWNQRYGEAGENYRHPRGRLHRKHFFHHKTGRTPFPGLKVRFRNSFRRQGFPFK
jgi:hypothetical protein